MGAAILIFSIEFKGQIMLDWNLAAYKKKELDRTKQGFGFALGSFWINEGWGFTPKQQEKLEIINKF